MISTRVINRVICAMLGIALTLAICTAGVWHWKSKAPDRARKRFHQLGGSLQRNAATFSVSTVGLAATLKPLKQIDGVNVLDFRRVSVDLNAAMVCGELDQIRAIVLGKSKIDPAVFIELAKMRQLQAIDLSERADLEPFLAEIHRFQNLDSLHLLRSSVDEKGALQLAKHPKIAKLTLMGAALETKALQSILGMRNLRELWLQDAKPNSNFNEVMEPTATSSVQTLLWFGGEDDFAKYGDYLFASDKLPNLQSLELGCTSKEVLKCVQKAQIHQNLYSLRLLVDKMPDRSAFPMLKQVTANLGIELVDKEGNVWDNTRGYQPANLDEMEP